MSGHSRSMRILFVTITMLIVLAAICFASVVRIPGHAN